MVRNAARQILILRRQATRELEAFCRELAESILKSENVEMIFGIDGQAEDLHTAYLQANRAWYTAAFSNTPILPYDALNMELLLDDVTRERKVEYLKKVFRNADAGEMADYIGILEAFFGAEGSLQKAAQTLYIHKNTVQYRIKRLTEVTGLDVRRPSQAPALYLAMLFYLDLTRGGEEMGF